MPTVQDVLRESGFTDQQIGEMDTVDLESPTSRLDNLNEFCRRAAHSHTPDSPLSPSC